MKEKRLFQPPKSRPENTKYIYPGMVLQSNFRLLFTIKSPLKLGSRISACIKGGGIIRGQLHPFGHFLIDILVTRLSIVTLI